MTKQIKWALDVLNSGAWWDNIPDDASDADMNPLYDAITDAITAMNGMLKRLTYCSECKYFKQKSRTFGDCERYNCRKGVFDFCSDGKAREEEK